MGAAVGAAIVIVFLLLAAIALILTAFLVGTLCYVGVCSIPILAKGVKLVVVSIVLILIVGALCIALSLALELTRKG